MLFVFLSVSFCFLCRCVPVGFFSSTPEHLQRTASLVKTTVLGSKADGTVRTYLGGFRRWKRWASSSHLCLFPANRFQVAIYLQCLFQDANSPSPVLNAVYSIDWAQQVAGLLKIYNHPLVSLMVSASQRLLGSQIGCLVSYRFRGFFRFSELSQIKACDVRIFPSYASIFLESSKTDQFCDGAWIVIARSDLPTCPVKPWKHTSQLRRSTSPKIYLCSEPLLLLGQKRWSEAKGLAIRELANLLRMLLEV